MVKSDRREIDTKETPPLVFVPVSAIVTISLKQRSYRENYTLRRYQRVPVYSEVIEIDIAFPARDVIPLSTNACTAGGCTCMNLHLMFSILKRPIQQPPGLQSVCPVLPSPKRKVAFVKRLEVPSV